MSSMYLKLKLRNRKSTEKNHFFERANQHFVPVYDRYPIRSR